MNKKNITKIVTMSAAALTTASLISANNQNVKADTPMQDNNHSVVTAANTKTVTDNDLANAKRDVADDENDVATKNAEVNTAKQNVKKANTNVADAQNNVDKAKQNVATAQNNVLNAETDNNTQNTQVKQAQAKLTAEQNNNQDLQKQKTVAAANVTTAQTKQSQDQAAYDNAKKQNAAVNAKKQELAQKVADKASAETQLKVSDSYIKSMQKYDQEVAKAYRDTYAKTGDGYKAYLAKISTFYKVLPDYNNDMKKASNESRSLNYFVDSDKDKQNIVDLDNMTDSQKQEINEYTVRLINDLRQKMRQPALILNSDVMKMAEEIGTEYNKDNRSNLDNKGHDYRAINKAAKDFGLIYDPENKKNYYEDLAGWESNSTFVLPTKDQRFNAYNQMGYIPRSEVSHITNMNAMKQGAYLGLMLMMFNDHEWEHAYNLMNTLDSGHPENPNVRYLYGFATSVLPNTNEVSTHFIIVPTNEITKSDDSKYTISEEHNIPVTSLAQEQTALRNAQEALANATQVPDLAKLANILIQDQTEVTNAQNNVKALDSAIAKSNIAINKYQQLLNDYANNNQASKLTKAQMLLTNAQTKLTLAKTNLQEQLLNKDNAEIDLTKKQDALKTAQEKLNSAKKYLSQLQATYKMQHKVTIPSAKPSDSNKNQTKPNTSKDDAKHNQTPVVPAKPTNTTDHNQNTKPVEPAKPVDTTDHSQTITPVVPSKPTDTNKNDQTPVIPTEPVSTHESTETSVTTSDSETSQPEINKPTVKDLIKHPKDIKNHVLIWNFRANKKGIRLYSGHTVKKFRNFKAMIVYTKKHHMAIRFNHKFTIKGLARKHFYRMYKHGMHFTFRKMNTKRSYTIEKVFRKGKRIYAKINKRNAYIRLDNLK